MEDQNMSDTQTTSAIPGYTAGTWSIDQAHTDVSFTVRHMMVSKVRGRFTQFEGSIVTSDELTQSTVNVTVDLSSINTNNEQRDDHLRSADFFEADKHEKMTFTSTAIKADGEEYIIEGDLT